MQHENPFFSGAKLVPGQHVDFQGIYKKLRALAPKCPQCAGMLENPNAGKFKKKVVLESQETIYICEGCFYDELGEALLRDTPK